MIKSMFMSTNIKVRGKTLEKRPIRQQRTKIQSRNLPIDLKRSSTIRVMPNCQKHKTKIWSYNESKERRKLLQIK